MIKISDYLSGPPVDAQIIKNISSTPGDGQEYFIQCQYGPISQSQRDMILNQINDSIQTLESYDPSMDIAKLTLALSKIAS